MAQFYNKILKNEEELGGYNVGEPDDDIFKLGDSAYPGDIQEFLNPDPIVSEGIPESESNISDYQAPSNDLNIWDNFDSQSTYETAEESEDLLHNLDVTDKLDEQTNSDVESIDTVNIPSANISQPNVEEVTFDDEFKQRLASLIRPEKDKSIAREIDQPVDNTIKEQEFKPVEEIAQTDFINISDINIARPSETIIKDVEIEKESLKTNKTKKDKKKFPFLFIIILAASIILLSIAAFLYFESTFNKSKSNITQHDSTKKEIKKEIKKVESPKYKTDSSKVVKKIDTVKETPKIEIKSELKVEKESVKKINVPAITKIEKKPVIEKQKKIIVEKIVKSEPKKIVQKTEPVKEPKKVEKKEKVIVKNTLKEKKETKPKAQTEIITNTETKSKAAVYTVQVYSSPSKDDALEWLNKLRGKNITDGFISEQMVRDVKWFRVRFGQFESREQARSAALRYGFAQTWIDRVK
jgi:septal ring-binding cell division protein DamX